MPFLEQSENCFSYLPEVASVQGVHFYRVAYSEDSKAKAETTDLERSQRHAGSLGCNLMNQVSVHLTILDSKNTQKQRRNSEYV